jgi:Protein of unknown function (DUF1236)
MEFPVMAHRVESLRCEGSDAIGAKRACRERRKRVDLTKMTQSRHAQDPLVTFPKLNLTLEQRYIVKEIIKDMKIEPAPAKVQAVGDQVPDNIRLQPIPSDVAQKAPQIRTYRFFVTDKQIVIVDPKDNKVAEIIKLD